MDDPQITPEKPLGGRQRTPSPDSSPLSDRPTSLLSPQFLSPIPLRSRNQNLTDEAGLGKKKGNISLSNQDSILQSSFTSSQRMVRDGEVVVTNSDSNDGEDDSLSVSSLESTEDIFNKFQPKASFSGLAPSGSAPSSPRKKSTEKGFILPSHNSRKPKMVKESENYQFSLDTLVSDTIREKRTDNSVAMAKQSITKLEADGRPMTKGADKAALMSAVEDKSDAAAVRRLRDAVDRTEAFEQAKDWTFFLDQVVVTENLEFPVEFFDPGSWEGVLRGPDTRDRAFFSGVVGKVLADRDVFFPDEFMLWIFYSVVSEPRETLRTSYCSALAEASTNRLSSLITPTHIDSIFLKLGARPEALCLSDELQPLAHVREEYKCRDNRYLISTLELLQAIASKLHISARSHALKLVLRLVIDEKIANHSAVCAVIDRCILSLIENSRGITDEQFLDVAIHLFETVKHAEFQIQLLQHIPPATPRIGLFRSRLACAFLFRDPAILRQQHARTVSCLDLIELISFDPRFDTNSHAHSAIDFADLCALTRILGIAIGILTPGRTEQAKEAFNSQIDTLASVLKAVFSSIKDPGAAFMKRTETKEHMQALYYSLLYGIRTNPPPPKRWFVSDEQLAEEVRVAGAKKSAEFMNNFIKRG